MSEGDRTYGTDSTDEFDTIAEATQQADGSLHFEVVTVDKRDFPGDPRAPRLLDLGGQKVQAIATGVLFGQQIETRAIVSEEVGHRLRIAVYQGDRTATLALVDGDTVVASTVTSI